MAPKTRSKKRTPPPPTLRALNPEYSLRKVRLEDLAWSAIAGYCGDGTIMIRASWPKDIGFEDPHTANPQKVTRFLALLDHVKSHAQQSPRANFGAPFVNPRGDAGGTPRPDWQGHWLLKPDVDLRTFPESFYADADRIQIATQKTWRKSASPAATWRAVHIAQVQPTVPWCFCLVDVDGQVAAIVAPTRKDR